MRTITCMGIDPGSKHVGVALIRVTGQELERVWSTTLELKEKDKAERLGHLSRSVGVILVRHRPDVVCLESGYVGINPKSSLTLAESRGAVCAQVSVSGMRLIEVTPSVVKQAATGKGNATKDEVRSAVKAIFRMEQMPEENEADALGCALAGANRV